MTKTRFNRAAQDRLPDGNAGGEPASSTAVTLMPGVPTSSSRSGRARRTIPERQAAWEAVTFY
jgi:hypothetical protein